MEFKIRQQKDLPFSIDGQNIHVIIFPTEKMVFVSGEYFDAYKLHLTFSIKAKLPDKFAMVAYDGTVSQLSVQLALRGIKFGDPLSQRASFKFDDFHRAYNRGGDFDPDKFSWKRWGTE